MDKKNPWKSWTLWLNGVGMLGVSVLGFLTDQGLDLGQWGIIGISVANFLLRFKTTQPVV